MHPVLMFIIAIALPLTILLVFFLPFYVSIVAALYVQYGAPVLEHAYSFFTTLKFYGQLYDYWSANSSDLDFVSFTLPTLGIPALGAFTSLYGTYRVVRYIRDIFVLS